VLLEFMSLLFLLFGCQSRTEDSRTTTTISPDTPGRAADTQPLPPVLPTDTPELPRPKPQLPTPKPPPKPAEANITVSFPKPETRLTTNRLLITGTARTFENSVAYKVLGPNGRELASGHATAVGEMGQHNPFSIPVRLSGPLRALGEVRIFEYSAKDGSVINLVRVPVRFDIPPDSTG
jgi:hypothetical protein